MRVAAFLSYLALLILDIAPPHSVRAQDPIPKEEQEKSSVLENMLSEGLARILDCVVFCCVVLCFVVLCCVLLCCVVFCCVVLCFVVLCCVLWIPHHSSCLSVCPVYLCVMSNALTL